MPTKNILLEKIGNFRLFWKYDLQVILENAENLLRHPQGSDCKCYVLHHLVNSYVNSAVNLGLMKVYEVTEMIKNVDKTFQETMPNELKVLRTMRNKLLAHKEEELLKPEWLALAKEVQQTDWAIIDQLRAGIQIILEKIEHLNPPSSGYSMIQPPRFSSADIGNLITEATLKNNPHLT